MGGGGAIFCLFLKEDRFPGGHYFLFSVEGKIKISLRTSVLKYIQCWIYLIMTLSNQKWLKIIYISCLRKEIFYKLFSLALKTCHNILLPETLI